MTDQWPTADLILLSFCAILRWFDRDLLLALAQPVEAELVLLLASDLVVPSPERAGAYHLREDVRTDVLGRLHADRPPTELELHTRVFEYFLYQTEQAESAEQRMDHEGSCFYHLDKLVFLLVACLDWSAIIKYTGAARALGTQDQRHLQRLALYDGYVAARTQDYERGEAILTGLLAQAELQDDVRLNSLNALAQMYRNQAHYDRALAMWRRLDAFAHETANLVFQGLALLNMSNVYNELEHYDRALDLATQSLQIFRTQGEQVREAYALYIVGVNAMYLGRWQSAREHFDLAIRRFEALGIEAGLALLHWSYGYLHHMLGNESESEAAYLHALSLAQSSEPGEPLVAMDAYLYLGFLYYTQRRYDAAMANYQRALALAARLQYEHRVSLIHYQRGNVFKAEGRLDETLAAYSQAIGTIESLRVAIEAEEIKIGLLGTTQQMYEATTLLCLERDRPAEAFDYVERARSRAFLDVLAKKSPDLYDAFDQPVATLAEVQAGLPVGALLLEYFTIGVLPRGESLLDQLPPKNTRLREHMALPPQTLIFAITRDRLEVHAAPLNPNMLRPQPGDPSPARRLLRDRLLAQLYESLIAPVAHLLRGCELLYLVPHGPLHYVPFMALRPPGGAYLLHSGGPAIALAPSATVLLRNCVGRPPSGGAGLLALGYNDQEGDPLRYAEAEARHIAGLMGGAAISGPAPKRAQLLTEGRRARWLHIAGHAIYNPRDPLESELRIGAGDSLSARAIIGELDLDADLVTLSACTSGVSRVVAGDEQLGLQRAFLYAGARAVLCTLWEAADLVALLLMDHFYTNVRRGRPLAAALRDAQAAVREMTGRDLLETFERWRVEDPELLAALGELPSIPPEYLDAPPYAEPSCWAPFMLIGRA